eukprot:scaffold31620_cov101-Isochrysis_galbana.AAC.2
MNGSTAEARMRAVGAGGKACISGIASVSVCKSGAARNGLVPRAVRSSNNRLSNLPLPPEAFVCQAVRSTK